MRVLQISSDFANQRLYDLLVSTMAGLGISQVVYVPVRRQEEMNRNINPNLVNVEYQYSFILNKLDRINYFGKIKKTSNDLIDKVDLSSIRISHAHFLFSDGGIALALKKNFGIPYIVAVRNTDLNVFFKYLVHLRGVGVKILQNAEKVIFLSGDYRNRLLSTYVPKGLRTQIFAKSVVIPNGVDDFWLTNRCFRNDCGLKRNFLYVGNFSKNKNVDILIRSIVNMSKIGKDVHLTLVGGGGNDENRIIKLCESHADLISYKGKVLDKEKLMSIYRSCNIFVMASSHETFGLVYIEAMSQGLPIIYTLNEGISGYFEEGDVGYGVIARNSREIIEKSDEIFKDWVRFSQNAVRYSADFSWERIGQQYLNIYQSSSVVRDE
ncbi:glycosyl transferase [Parapedobacter defluvii]|uniref:Glycosyl transferase n=1 Tax=Parapedobacter defluvii TaxID=2045106 RepID=A0ABQ1MDV2_9SPHI|nr:glycosyltransferase family 4 protein [Parapedobacter defluvii]GGC38870.1 glycosyl transferase [Parapedobacter defluvii]